MSNPSFHAALRQHLQANATPFNADLIEWVLAERPEIQCNIRTDVGTPKTDGKFRYRLDGNCKFWNVRWPKDAKDNPNWDYEPGCKFPFSYFQEIGTTGFTQSGNQAYGLDVDSVWGHGNGLPDERLQQIYAVLEPIDYAALRRSTQGKGFHVWIHATGVEDANHAEHQAVGRALLGQLCLDAGLEFAADVDVVGSNMWIASRRATVKNRGFELLKPATRILTLGDIPSNWRDHLVVVTKKGARVRVLGSDADQFAELATTTVMDDEHRRITEAYKKTGFAFIYVPDFCCWHGHTAGLAAVHAQLGLKGFFKTVSDGSDPTTPNCYIFLRPNGMFYVVRFKTQQEHSSWGKTQHGERSCYFNCAVDLRTAGEVVGGAWTGNAVTCHTLTQATQLAEMLGGTLPPLATDRPINFKHTDTNTIAAETTQVKGEVVKGWGIGYRKLVATFNVELQPTDEDNYLASARHVITPERENAGYLMLSDDGDFVFEPKGTVENLLPYRFGVAKKDISAIMGKIAANPYTLVNEPLQAEFLPGKKWNKFGAQLCVAPTYDGNHPHYDKILRHVGAGLDDAVKNDLWCQNNGITTGYDFLLLWCALLVRDSKQHLPMLYLYSDKRDNGKSAFHKAIGKLFSRGYVSGVLLLNEKFNGLLAGAVLVYLDEEKVSQQNAQKVKIYIEADKVNIRLMRSDAFMFSNFSHWIATYNFTDGVPVEDGDERVIMLEVPVLDVEEKNDWKKAMEPALESERSDFLGTLMGIELPPSGGRLYLPVLSTPLKEQVMAAGRTGAKPSYDCNELLARIVAVVNEKGQFRGTSGEFAKLLGPGSWDSSLNHLRRYLRELAPKLAEHGIKLDLSIERIIILDVVPC